MRTHTQGEVYKLLHSEAFSEGRGGNRRVCGRKSHQKWRMKTRSVKEAWHKLVCDWIGMVSQGMEENEDMDSAGWTQVMNGKRRGRHKMHEGGDLEQGDNSQRSKKKGS